MTWGETPSSDDKTMALLAHLSVFVAPFLGPIVFYVLFQEKSAFIKYHAVQALVSHVLVWVVILIGLTMVTLISFITCGIGGVLYPLLGVIPFIHLYGAFKAYQGEWDGYPLMTGVGRG
jgi:uncharacterized protein